MQLTPIFQHALVNFSMNALIVCSMRKMTTSVYMYTVFLYHT